MSFLIAASAIALTIVPANDPTLALEKTFVSQVARDALVEKSVDQLHCLDAGLPEGGPDRVCLTAGEWQAVFDRAGHDEAADRRQRLAELAVAPVRR